MHRIEYDKWLNSLVVDEKTKLTLKTMTESDILECFYRDLEFGTGGLRGKMNVGTNRMNIYTVRHATQGLANEIISNGDTAVDMGVVIAYDSRNNSSRFAFECVKVLCANGIKTYLFDSLRPTPMLSFAVRYLKCFRGIVITASHNPKEYNGYKVYGEDGGQITPESASIIENNMKSTDIFDDVKITDTPDFISVGRQIDEAYISEVLNQRMGNSLDDLKVIYTPLHGSGNIPVRNVLQRAGLNNLFVVPEQEMPDGDFSTVKSPNPENPEAFDLAIKYAEKIKPDLIIGTDPDSDRVGVAVPFENGYITLNGNQTGVLLCEFILRKLKETGSLNSNLTIIKTIVTTEMIKAVTQDYGVGLTDVLTGFKYIGEKIKEYEDENCSSEFLFGLEESYGYLKGTYTRDKDAVVASLLICEMAAYYKEKGQTLYDGLCELYERYGYYSEKLLNFTFDCADGIVKIKTIMDTLRNKEVNTIGGLKVANVKDYLKGIDDLPKSDVLKYFFDCGWLAVRPSGTEPKIKFYICASGENQQEVNKNIDNISEFINETVGI